MKAVSVLAVSVATALIVAVLAQAAALRNRMLALPPPPAAAPDAPVASAEPPPSPFELREMAARTAKAAKRLDEKMAREKEQLAKAEEEFGGLKLSNNDALAVMDREAAKVREEIGDPKRSREEVEALTKKIKADQQKAMIKRFAGEQMRRENEKLKAELAMTPEQAAEFDKVAAEMMDKVAEMGSSFMDGEMNVAAFQKLQTETNERMATFLDEGQMTRYKDYQQKRWGGRGQQQGGDQGEPK